MGDVKRDTTDVLIEVKKDDQIDTPTEEQTDAEKKLLENGYEGIKFLTNYSYDTALIGVTTDDRAVYDFDLMVQWLMDEEGCTEEEALEWIEYNTNRALPYMGADGPIVMYRLME